MFNKLLATATAVLATVSVANAADLNKATKAVVDYVKVCDAYGAGFFYIPGSDTCLKVGGRVYQDFRIGGGVLSRESTSNSAYSNKSRTGTEVYSRSAAYFNLDARTNTEYGLLRSFEEFRLRFSTSGSNSGTTEIDLPTAFVQFGGLTAGKTRSYFDFAPAGYTYNMDYGVFQTNTLINSLAYTFSFGNGVTGTLAVQDPTTADDVYNNWLRNEGTIVGIAGEDTYGGLSVPDFIANLNVSQAWGSAQLAIASHQDYSLNWSSKMGFAINGGVEYKLDAIAKGDKIAVQAGYALGSQGFLTALNSGSGNIRTVFDPGNYIGEDWTVVNGTIKQTSTFGGLVSFDHEFSPNYALLVDATYLNVNGYGNRDEQAYGLQSTFLWKPTADPKFHIGLAGEYGAINYTSATKNDAANRALNGGKGIYNESGFEFALRVNRVF
jgi:hypothetical protein